MIWKVSFVLFLCALYCADGKTWAHKPRPVGHDIVERFLQKDSKTSEVVEPQKDGFEEGDDDDDDNADDDDDADDIVDDNSSNGKNEEESGAQDEDDDEEQPDTGNLEVGQEHQPLPSIKSSDFHHSHKIPFQRFPASVLHSVSKASRQRNHPLRNPLEFGVYRRNNDDGRDFNVENLLNNFNNGEPLDKDEISQLTKLFDRETQSEGLEKSRFDAEFQKFEDDTLKRLKNQRQNSGKVDPSRNKDAKVGFAPNFFSQQLKVADLTEYVRKAIAKNLPKLPSKIPSENSPLMIEEIPGVPVKLQLKYVEGFSSLVPFEQSKGFYTNKFFAFTQAKFNQLRFFYDVQIKPFGMFNIQDKLSIVLHDAPIKLQFSMDKEMQTNLLHFEYVNPQVRLDYNGNFLVNMGLDYIINSAHPVVKQKLVEIVSRDSKMMLQQLVSQSQ